MQNFYEHFLLQNNSRGCFGIYEAELNLPDTYENKKFNLILVVDH